MSPDIFNILIPVATIAAAYGGVKSGLNGTKENIRELTQGIRAQSEKIDNHSERITAVEVETRHIKKSLERV